LRGQAQDSAALGDTITVQNVQSKRFVQGVVTAPGRVTAAPARFVETEPAPASVSPPSDQPQPEHSVE
jgi:flagella basal body P-ring formation protein FlgA